MGFVNADNCFIGALDFAHYLVDPLLRTVRVEFRRDINEPQDVEVVHLMDGVVGAGIVGRNDAPAKARIGEDVGECCFRLSQLFSQLVDRQRLPLQPGIASIANSMPALPGAGGV